jgi:dienelactone hydrolase
MLAGAGIGLARWARQARTPSLPSPTGPHAVGRLAYDWLVIPGPGATAPDPSDARKPGVWAWYPAAPGQRGKVPTVLVPDAPRQAGGARRDAPPPTPAQRLAAVQVHAIPGARLATSGTAYPVLIMQPGWGRPVTDYSTLAEELASHGYIVFGVTPPLGTGPAEEIVAAWADAYVSLRNQLEQVNRADPLGTFTGRLDLTAVGLVGHSAGGAAAAEACRRDPRFKAGVDLDGYPAGPVVSAGLAQPFMFIWSEVPERLNPPRLQALRDTEAIQRRLHRDGYQLIISGARHFNFSDYAVLDAPDVKTQVALGSIDGRRGLQITREYVRAFFDRYLKGSDEPLLEGGSPGYPEVYLRRAEAAAARGGAARPVHASQAG